MARHDLRCGNGSLKTLVLPHGRLARLFCAGALLALPALAQAGQITISWDPDPAATTVGYRLHNAPSGQPFAPPIEVGSASSYTLTGLDPARAYHAAVSAYDIFGQVSPLSVEVVYTPAVDGVVDTDQDGLPDALENAACTSPTDVDTDDDGIPDGIEDANRNGVRDPGETGACTADTDGDRLQDGTELCLTLAQAVPDTDLAVFRPDLDPASATDPLVADTDGDGLADGAEDTDANGCVDAGETDPCVADNPLLFSDSFSDGGPQGDPSWKRSAGTWSVAGRGKRFASKTDPVSMALIADPKVREFRSGRIESWVSLTPAFVKGPDARILFHYEDAAHYRYLKLSAQGLALGQVGSNLVEMAGVKASRQRPLKLMTGHRVRIDIVNGTLVRVYLNGETKPALAYRFIVDSAGRVGYRTEGARSFFDNAAVWSDSVLQ